MNKYIKFINGGSSLTKFKNTYKNLLVNQLEEFDIDNFRCEMFYEDARLMFDIQIENELKTCVIFVDLTMTNYKIKRDIKDKFIPNFIEVYNWIVEGENAEDNYNIDDNENEDEEEDYESIDSVAAGCGFYIDDDGHWIPLEDDYSSWGDYDDSPMQLEYTITLPDGTKKDAVEYNHFILY